jgi:hypothetical protein
MSDTKTKPLPVFVEIHRRHLFNQADGWGEIVPLRDAPVLYLLNGRAVSRGEAEAAVRAAVKAGVGWQVTNVPVDEDGKPRKNGWAA